MSLVEFQPSGFARGSYLNVSAHWLWSPAGEYSFHFSERASGFIEYVDDEQFAPLAAGLARQAAEIGSRHSEMFATVDLTAEALIADFEKHDIPDRPGGWPAFHVAVAAMLAGRMDTAYAMFQRAAEGEPSDIVSQAARRFEAQASNLEQFRSFISDRIRKRRVESGLPELIETPFQSDAGAGNVP